MKTIWHTIFLYFKNTHSSSFPCKWISSVVHSWFLLEIIFSLLTPCSLMYFKISACLSLPCYPDSFHLARSNIKGCSKCYGALLLLLSFAVKTFSGVQVFIVLLFYFLLVYLFISEWQLNWKAAARSITHSEKLSFEIRFCGIFSGKNITSSKTGKQTCYLNVTDISN